MDLNKLPFVPLNFFYFQFASGSKRLFLYVMALVLIATFGVLFAYHNPFYWTLQFSEIADTAGSELSIAQVEANYRSFDMTTTAYHQMVNFSALPLYAKPFPTFLFWFLQLSAWALLLSAATLIRSRWYLLFFGLFGLFLVFSDVTSYFATKDPYHIALSITGLVFLGLGYMFQRNPLKFPIPYRFLTFFALLIGVFGYVLLKNDWTELHRMTSTTYPYLMFLTLFFLFFVGKEPTNLLIFAATNHRNQEARRSRKQIIIMMLVLFVWEALLLSAAMDFNIGLKSVGLRPIHLLAISAVMMIFLSQNQFNAVKKMFSTVNVYTFILAAWSLISMSFIFLMAACSDTYFVEITEKLAITFFLFIGIGHLVYLSIEFSGLMEKKINLYYLIGQSGNYMFSALWLMGTIGFVVVEGHDRWQSIKIWINSYFVQQADYHFVKGDMAKAESYYDMALNGKFVNLGFGTNNGMSGHLAGVKYQPKAAFNMAAIKVSDNKFSEAATYYTNATQYYKFPAAQLVAGNLMTLVDKAGVPLGDAKKFWRNALQKNEDAHIYNNLGMLYLAEGKKDSAIISFRNALKIDKNMSSAYSNLAEVYWNNKLRKEAKDFTKAALDVSNPSDAAIINGIWHFLKDTVVSDIPDISPDAERDFYLQNNYAFYLMKKQENKKAAKWFELFQKSEEEVLLEIQLLSAYQWALQDSIAKAASKMDFITKVIPEFAGKANYTMGLAYYKRGVPEMAKYYFRNMFDNGDTTGLYYQALVEADMGQTDSAFAHLTMLRGYNAAKYNNLVKKELALLNQSKGLETAALSEWDFKGITRDEQMRIGIYADSTAGYAFALTAFRKVIDKDSSYAAPYTEMLKIYRRYKNPEALSNGEYLLKRFPNDAAAQLEMVKVYLDFNKNAEAQKLVTALKSRKDTSYKYETEIWESKLLLAQKDTAKATVLLQKLFKQNVLNQLVLTELAEIYKRKKQNEEGYRLLYDAVRANTENAEIWYYLAYFTRAYGILDDAKFDAERAILLSTDPKRKAEIAQEFDDLFNPPPPQEMQQVTM